MMRLLIYGLQRSGTNYAEELLRRRYRVQFLNVEGREDPRHKHARLYADKTLVPTEDYRHAPAFEDFASFEETLAAPAEAYLVVSKNPYAWLRSYCQWSARSGWPAPTHHYAEEYSAFYGQWANFASQSGRVALLRYDALLRDPAGALAELERAVPLPGRPLRAIRNSAPRYVPQSGAFTRAQRAAYLRGDYLRELGPDGIAEVNRHVSADLIAQLGYERAEAVNGPPRSGQSARGAY